MCILASAHAPRIMGCGKSRLRSPEASDVDLKKSNSNSNTAGNGGKQSKKNSRNGGGKSNSGGGIGGNNRVGGGVIQQQQAQAGGSDGTSGSGGSKNSPSAQAQSGKKKKNFFSGASVTANSENERKSGEKEKEALLEAKPPSSSKKSLSNGKSARPRERNDEIGVSPTRQPKTSTASATGSGPAGDLNERQNGGKTGAHNRPYLLEVPNEIPSSNNAQSKTAVRDFKSLTASKIVHVTKSQIEFFKMLDEKIEKGADYVTSGNTSEVSSLCEFDHH